MGLVGENKDTGMERRHRAVMQGGREGGPMVMGVGVRLWFLREFGQNHYIPLVLSSVHFSEP